MSARPLSDGNDKVSTAVDRGVSNLGVQNIFPSCVTDL